MANLRLFFETESKSLSLSEKGPLGFQMPTLRQEDTMSLEISILRQVNIGIFPQFEKQTVTAYSLRASVGTAASVLATVTSFTPSADGYSLTGNLDLKTAGISALADNSEVYFEIIATLNGTDYGKRFPVKVEKGIFTSGALVTPPGDTALGRAEADRTYFKKVGEAAFEMLSTPGGFRMLVQCNDDGSLTASPIV